MRFFTSGSGDGLDKFLTRRRDLLKEYEDKVGVILRAVRAMGDLALLNFTDRFDGVRLEPDKIRVEESEIGKAYQQVDDDFLAALRQAGKNIENYHRARLPRGWLEPDSGGNLVGHLCRPLSRVGIYVPGGTAVYPSSVLMNALPAKVAGVQEIVMVTPPARDGSVNPYILVAAAEAGVTEIYRVGGAQAVAALAYGTPTIKAVDKVIGPGNSYVAMAKKQVYGLVDIDMVAGPSEILVVADISANPAWLAADLLSQAEHDPEAVSLLITPETGLAREVEAEIASQLPALARREIARQSLDRRGAVIVVKDLEEAMDLANTLAPEHLELMVSDPWIWLDRVRNAGAVFLGRFSPESVGDYWAGPNHVLPTGGTARYASPLGVEDFLKRINVISYSMEGLDKAGPGIIRLAEAEGLTAHAAAVERRLEYISWATGRQNESLP